jgi:hypothetical protein
MTFLNFIKNLFINKNYSESKKVQNFWYFFNEFNIAKDKIIRHFYGYMSYKYYLEYNKNK